MILHIVECFHVSEVSVKFGVGAALTYVASYSVYLPYVL